MSIDQGDAESVQRWIDERNLTFTVLHDRSGRIQQIYQTTGVPESWVLDRDGKIVRKGLRGPALERAIEKLLSAKKS